MNEKEKVRQRIIEKAKQDFAKYGFSGVKTDALASDLGMSKRTLYSFFSSKKELLSEVINSAAGEMKQKMSAVVKQLDKPDSDFIETLKEIWDIISSHSQTFTKEFFEDLKKYAPEQWKKIEDLRIKQLKSNFTKIHNIGVKKGYVKPDIDKEIFYLLYHFSINNILSPEIVSETPLTTKRVFENIIDVLLTGSLTEKGRSEYLKKNIV